MANDKIDMKDYSVTSTADIPSRSVISVISCNSIDEEGEVILPRGVQIQRFQKSPVVFWNHNYEDPIATCEYIKVTDDNLIASTYFPERPDNHVGEWRPDTVLSMVASGLCQGVSIGFSYIETREPTSKDRKQFPTTGNELQRVVSKSRLLEYSFAPLPMNEDALVVAVQRGFVNQDGSLNERAIKSCRLELDGVAQRSVRLIPSQSLKLKAIDTDKMTKIEIQRLQGRVY